LHLVQYLPIKAILKQNLGALTCIIIEKNEMGGSCGAYGRGESCAQGVGGKVRGKEAIGETQT
jgi:hypothetical protein